MRLFKKYIGWDRKKIKYFKGKIGQLADTAIIHFYWMKLEPIIKNEISQKEKHQYSILMHIYGIQKDGNDNPVCETTRETQMY